jgi:uncharacterized membrane protein
MSAKLWILACGFALATAIGLSAPIWHDEAIVLLEFAGRDTWPGTVASSSVLKLSLFRVSPGLHEVLSNVSRLGFQITPPLYYVTVWIWGRVMGNSLLAFRLMSVACWLGVLAVFHRWFPSRFALALLMLSPLGIEFATLARNYAMAILWIILTALFLDPERAYRKRNIAFGCISAGLAVWTHYFALFPVAIIGLWAVCHARQNRKRLMAVLGSAAMIAAIPLAKFVLAQIRPTGTTFGGAREVIHQLARIIPRIALSPFLITGPWVDLTSSLLCVAAILAAAVTFRTRSNKVRLCLLIVLGQPIALAILSFLMRSNLAQGRYLGLALPFFYPLFSDLFGRLSGIMLNWRYLSLGIAALCAGADALQLIQLEHRRTEAINNPLASPQLFVARPSQEGGIYAEILHDIPDDSYFVVAPATDQPNDLDNILPRYKLAWLCPSDASSQRYGAMFLKTYKVPADPVRLFREYSCQRLSLP